MLVLAASIRNLQHLLDSFHIGAELVTVPAKTLEEWAKEGICCRQSTLCTSPSERKIPYQELHLEQPWQRFNIEHELTRKGIQKFVSDYRSTLRKAS